ncbi:hypothetical protein Ppa06_08410 [Planomonospora parontospora subsp. parontospora]|uniref:Uncharacterized protein n=2 Tax=Planomonospora parontospora TaxID=58119 RepID=A0AA37BCL6_9ACTN|nr:hypothetical protein [Planomonospora parontospora]GGK51085.1 hypothetical protein GCM10010126_08200 [Planomonospora parontospora]GII07043.1 hypothetical protein Ppa06_08410 [Planomonospora parontospora subsp. parontospora]
MTDRIEAAAAELRPLLQEFILWARENAPGSDSNLVGSVALWHRLIASDDVGRWRTSDLRTVLLERMPKVVEDPEAAAEGLVPAVRAYLAYLSDTARLSAGSSPLKEMLAELDEIEDDVVDAMEELLSEDGEDAEEYDEEEFEGLGDFEPFADRLAALPTIRLRPDAELAAAARRSVLIAKARDLAVWVGTERRVGEEDLLTDAEIAEALAVLGFPVPEAVEGRLADAVPALWNVWNLAIDLDFLQPEGEDTVSVDPDTADWPFEEDDDVLDAWLAGLHSIDYGDPELDDEDATIALSGLTRALLVRVLLATGSKSLDDLRTELAEAAAEYDDLGAEAWDAATTQYGDPLNPVLDWLSGYGMVEVEHDQVRLTPLGMEGLVHLVDEADIELDARPAIDAMTALDLLAFSAELPEEEADAEFAAWMELREPARAAEELLAAAAEDDADALVRVQAASVVGSLGAVAVPAWRRALDEPSLHPYAATHLAQLGVEDVPAPTQADTHWLILDMLTISAGLGRPEFVSSLDDIGPTSMLVGLLDVIWKVPHPHLEELLETISKAHPDRQVGKAAKRALFKARSGDN